MENSQDGAQKGSMQQRKTRKIIIAVVCGVVGGLILFSVRGLAVSAMSDNMDFHLARMIVNALTIIFFLFIGNFIRANLNKGVELGALNKAKKPSETADEAVFEAKKMDD
jgi:hypothetical protein